MREYGVSVYKQLLEENLRLRVENQCLRKVAKNICDRWVSPDMYAHAMAELEEGIEEETRKMLDI